MTQLDDLVSSLLYEGYALYPYTPGATKNATPTPFGIVYPPSYAAGSGATFDHLQVQCLLRADEEPEVRPEVFFLQSVGERHTGVERRVGAGPFDLGDAPRGRDADRGGGRAAALADDARGQEHDCGSGRPFAGGGAGTLAALDARAPASEGGAASSPRSRPTAART